MLRDWSLVNKPEDTFRLEEWANELKKRSLLTLRITWDLTLQHPHHDKYLLNRCGVGVYVGSVFGQVGGEHELLGTVIGVNSGPRMILSIKVGWPFLLKK
jgi:hypothetical protein